MPVFLSVYCLLPADLLHISGITHGSALGLGIQGQPPSPTAHGTDADGHGTRGTDVLDASDAEIRLEKSNILLLGPTGSGECDFF